MLTSLERGTILRGRYRLKNIVGHGGMGNVYEAEDLRLPGRLCAVKEVQPEANNSPELRKQEHAQFLREASLLAQLDHPNLPKVSDFFEQDGRDYLVMDYVPGKNLKELIDDSRIQGRQLSVEVVMTWMEQLIDALEYLHRQNPPILHRDVKPANIKLTPDGRIKLVDFGLAKVMAGDDSGTITIIQGRGTAYYTPLEQYGAESEHTDARSDIYALGATLYHLLSGKPPPEAKERFLNASVLKPIEQINPEVKPTLAEAVHWALEMHPDCRPEDVTIFRKSLTGTAGRTKNATQPQTVASFGDAIRVNIYLLVVVLSLLGLALFVTIR